MGKKSTIIELIISLILLTIILIGNFLDASNMVFLLWVPTMVSIAVLIIDSLDYLTKRVKSHYFLERVIILASFISMIAVYFFESLDDGTIPIAIGILFFSIAGIVIGILMFIISFALNRVKKDNN